MSGKRTAAVLACASVLAFAAATATVEDLVRTVRGGLQSHRSDVELAKSLRRLALSERVDRRCDRSAGERRRGSGGGGRAGPAARTVAGTAGRVDAAALRSSAAGRSGAAGTRHRSGSGERPAVPRRAPGFSLHADRTALPRPEEPGGLARDRCPDHYAVVFGKRGELQTGGAQRQARKTAAGGRGRIALRRRVRQPAASRLPALLGSGLSLGTVGHAAASAGPRVLLPDRCRSLALCAGLRVRWRSPPSARGHARPGLHRSRDQRDATGDVGGGRTAHREVPFCARRR